MKVLVVDDDAGARDVARSVLESAGHEVEVVSTGRDAVDAYRRRPADVVLLDVLMPDQDGIETLRELRRIAPDARIVAMTGGDDIHLRSARLLGATEVLRKPYRVADLLRVTRAAKR